ncbi:MAG: hypothetical protein H7Y60_02245 [Rhodospirillaceae bacterium]|nr:hypothetical protein [Rhodospirillales bacterium]
MRRLFFAVIAACALVSLPYIGLASEENSPAKISLPLASGPLEIDPNGDTKAIHELADDVLAPALPTLKANAHRLPPPLLLELAYRTFRADRAEAAYWLEVAQARLLYDRARCTGTVLSPEISYLPYLMPYSRIYSDPAIILAARKKVLENERKWPDLDPAWTCARIFTEQGAPKEIAKDDWPKIRAEVRTAYGKWIDDVEASLQPFKPLAAVKVSGQVGIYGWTSDGWLMIGEIDLPSFADRYRDIQLFIKPRTRQVRGWQPPDRWVESADGKALPTVDAFLRSPQQVEIVDGQASRVAGKGPSLSPDPDRLVVRRGGQEVVVAAGRVGPPAVSPDRCYLAYSVDFDLFVAPLCAGQ